LKPIKHGCILKAMNRLFLISILIFGCTLLNQDPFIPPTIKDSGLKNRI